MKTTVRRKHVEAASEQLAGIYADEASGHWPPVMTATPACVRFRYSEFSLAPDVPVRRCRSVETVSPSSSSLLVGRHVGRAWRH